ncbi:SIR2 family protein [Dyadobacter sandarakinus]|uniref:SIR2 family protein n=1 Tax=Dyadobacter sandarakinus TaxID=2747268 RepID=A0ABX7I5S2_9BACT|nr:SIR2 family protein [Dyadobacter sandarakinus]QRR01449.1 SIR2 family protein [Dyadobacter sandarakinus]
MFVEQFLDRMRSFSTAPYLFVGSGLSNRYLEIGTWHNLLQTISSSIELQRNFNFYLSKANGDLPRVASLMGSEFHEQWWDKPLFQESRSNFEQDVINEFSPLKYEIAQYIKRFGIIPKAPYATEFELLKKVNIDGIITTNWDTLLQNVFPNFSVYIGQDNLIFNNTISIGEIYKIHGCVESPNTLTLTEEDYHQFNAKNPYLAAKLLTIFMEHPVIFLGYSLHDPNIQEILRSVMLCLSRQNVDKLRDRLIFCEYDRNVTSCTMSNTSMMIADINLPITIVKYKSLIDVYSVLGENARRLPIKILKHMKDMVFDFVKNSDSKSRIYVDDNFDLDQLDLKNVEFFFGVGTREKLAKIGVKGVAQQDLLDDIINPNEKFDSKVICKDLLQNITGVYFPFFKHLRNANLLDDTGNLILDDTDCPFTEEFKDKVVKTTIKKFFPGATYDRRKVSINEKYQTLEELIAGETTDQALIHIPLLSTEKINLDTLLTFLQQNYTADKKKSPFMKKAICLYDYLKYKLPELE